MGYEVWAAATCICTCTALLFMPTLPGLRDRCRTSMHLQNKLELAKLISPALMSQLALQEICSMRTCVSAGAGHKILRAKCRQHSVAAHAHHPLNWAALCGAVHVSRATHAPAALRRPAELPTRLQLRVLCTCQHLRAACRTRFRYRLPCHYKLFNSTCPLSYIKHGPECPTG